MRKIFYCWQSDIEYNINNSFIEECINYAIDVVNDIISEENEDTELFVLDKDTSGVSGSPPVSDTILKKIDECTVFIVDLTNVGKIKTNPEKFVPNPNVLIEYGYALKTVKHENLIAIINIAFGHPEEFRLPFDISHLRWPLQYSLTKGSSAKETSEQKEELRHLIEKELLLIAKQLDFKSGRLNVEILEDQSKFYCLRNNKVLFLLKIKISNKIDNDTSVVINEISIQHNELEYKAFRTGIGRSLETSRGNVTFGSSFKILSKEEDIRVQEYDSTTVNVAFELKNEKNFPTSNIENLKIKGIAQSYDGNKCYFQGDVSIYR